MHASGYAIVTAVDACPPIATGEGSVVLSRFVTREVQSIVRAEILGPDGNLEIIRGTTLHPFWSVDRNDWVPLEELEEGERLFTANGIANIVSISIERFGAPVYNIEVHGEHVYEVGYAGILVHNASSISGASNNAANFARYKDELRAAMSKPHVDGCRTGSLHGRTLSGGRSNW